MLIVKMMIMVMIIKWIYSKSQQQFVGPLYHKMSRLLYHHITSTNTIHPQSQSPS